MKSDFYKNVEYIKNLRQFENAGTLYSPVQTAASLFPDNVALRFLGKNITYKTLERNVEKYASAFTAAGLRNGEAVTFALPNIPESVYILYATVKAGLICSPLHPLSTPDAVLSAIEKTGSRIIFMLGDTAEKTAAVTKNATVVAVSPANSLGFKNVLYSLKSPLPKEKNNVIRLSTFLNSPQSVKFAAPSKICPSKPRTSILLQSGGTTGTPKVIELSADSVNNLAKRGLGILGRDEVTACGMLSVLPVFHGFGLAMGVHAMLCHGGKNVLFPKFHRASAVKEIRKGNIQFMIGVPRLYEALMSHPGFSGKSLKSLIIAFVGGDFVPRTLLDSFNKHIKENGGTCTLCEGYGLTETVTVCSVNTHHQSKAETVGKPLADIVINAFDFSGDAPRILPPGEKGELCISSDTIMNGYLSDNESTAHVFFEYDGVKYVRTGDCGFVDTENYVHFISRYKRIIKVKGIPVYPLEIEQLVSAQEGIGGVSVVCHPGDPEKILLFVETTDESVKDKLKTLIREKISVYAEPAEVITVPKFPLTNVSKTDTNALLRDFLNK